MPTGQFVVDEETQESNEVLKEMVTVTTIEPLEPTVEVTTFDDSDPTAEPTIETVPNPEIVKDNLERDEAQAIVDSTPIEVINTI
jgi:hypothetical protein